MTIVKESAPHIRRKASVNRMMIDVLIALAPTLIFSFIVYPLETLTHYVTSMAIMLACEFVYVGLKNMMPKTDEKHTFKEKFLYAYRGHYNLTNVLTPAITAVIFTLIVPAGAPIYAIIVGAFVGIVFGKLVFGGLGNNIFNPAALGMLFARLCFGSQYNMNVKTWYYEIPDTVAGATPLAMLNDGNFGFQYSLFDLFFGRIPGALGEVYKITIIIGLIYLLIRRSADFRIVASYLGTFILLTFIAGLSIYGISSEVLGRGGAVNPFYFTIYSLLSGGVLFGATFMLTDPVTSPINSPSRVIYGMVAAVVTVFIRLFAALPEGVGFSILFANMIACVLDHYEWSNPRYTYKKFIAMGTLIVIPALITFLAIYYGGIYYVR